MMGSTELIISSDFEFFFPREKFDRKPALPSLGEAEREGAKLSKARAAASAQAARRQHDWHEQADSSGVYCSRCLLTCQRGQAVPRSFCDGSALTPSMQKLIQSSTTGHKLQVANVEGKGVARSASGAMVVCATCGAYATKRPLLLLQTCKGPPGKSCFGQFALDRIQAGQHPADKSLRLSWTCHAAAVLGKASAPVWRNVGSQHLHAVVSGGPLLQWNRHSFLDAPRTFKTSASPCSGSRASAEDVLGSAHEELGVDAEEAVEAAVEELKQLQTCGLRVTWPSVGKEPVAQSSSLEFASTPASFMPASDGVSSAALDSEEAAACA